jgi:hypothetical protein
LLADRLEGVRSVGATWCYGRGRDVIPKPGCKVFKGEIVGLVEPGDERVRRFGIGRDTRGVNG